ncbi:MAG: NAD(P)/FAD-dependent oxidoreductase [Thermoleophilia bacterium]
MTEQQPPVDQVDAVVIGAGFSGIYATYKLRDELGLSVLGFEAGTGVGGTWYWNRYPGARVDTLSQCYCFTFSRELIEGWTYSERYPPQPEILAYLEYAAGKLDVPRSYRFQTRVEAMRWDDEAGVWHVRASDGTTTRARYVVSAVGCLSVPLTPTIEGIESFEGELYYTGHWPHEPVSFAGKRVGLIGTGATGVQVVPVVAEEAAHLTVFQRTPSFTTPTRNRPLTPEEQRINREESFQLLHDLKWTFGGNPLTALPRSVKDDPPEVRRAEFDRMFEAGDFSFWLANYNDILSDLEANEIAAEYLRDRIRQTVKDPVTAEKLCPRSYPYGTKRQPLDTGYFEAFNRDNVDLVDVNDDPIEAVVPEGVWLASGVRELDVIIMATGFDAMTGALNNIRIEGRAGELLADRWHDGPRAYLGLAVAGFPNLFIVTGPGSPSVLTNMPYAIEQHVEWIADAIGHAEAHGIAVIEATPEATTGWADYVNEIAAGTLFPDTASWYMGANIPGKPRVFMPYIGGLDQYRRECDEVAEKGYEGFRLVPAS